MLINCSLSDGVEYSPHSAQATSPTLDDVLADPTGGATCATFMYGQNGAKVTKVRLNMTLVSSTERIMVTGRCG